MALHRPIYLRRELSTSSSVAELTETEQQVSLISLAATYYYALSNMIPGLEMVPSTTKVMVGCLLSQRRFFRLLVMIDGITWVEKTKVSSEELKEEFLGSSQYETKTVGTRHNPAATPVGEGVYAITSTGHESHLAYMLTLPQDLGEVQSKLGLRRRGSFIISTRNPKYPGPSNASLPKGPEYTKQLSLTLV
jgi:hypothetical protein